ncbi:MAG: pyridoxamine 5'-phosphate oxidase [Candidatus Eremiobacteraeota bacterium]|nr:pyridoxamine 5'-phosphate oxidase [Candidatus Eremiobacteraeota bacterium]
MWEPFREPARRAIVLAQEGAQRYQSDHIGTEHITLGILEIDESPLLPLFEERGLNIDAYLDRVRRSAVADAARGGQEREMIFTPNAKQMIEFAFERARTLNHRFISTEHLVSALVRMPKCAAAKYLIELGFDLQAIVARMTEQLEALTRVDQRDIATSRRSYLRAALLESAVDADPIAQLQRWIAEAVQAEIIEPNAMSISTVDERGQPSSRIVLLRGIEQRGLVFFTSYLSRKGTELQKNPRAALMFYWPELERQARIEGSVEQVSDEESDAYFAQRPRGHQLSAWASEQSEPVESQALLAQRVEDYAARFEGEDVPRPHSWGGFLVRPTRIEFWQGRENRLHDRLEFTKEGTSWKLQRLSP